MLKKIFIVFLSLFISFAIFTTCLGYEQKNDSGKVIFFCPDELVANVKKLPEYADYVKGIYEIFILQDRWSGAGNYFVYFLNSGVKPYQTGRYSGAEINFSNRSGIRYNCNPSSPYTLSGRTTSFGQITGGFVDGALQGLTTTPVYTSNSYSAVFFPGIPLESSGSTEEPSPGPSDSTNVDYSQNGVFSWIGSFLQNILNALQGTLVSLNPSSDKFILKGFAEFFNSVGDFFSTLLDKLNPASDNFILKSIANFFGTIISYINPFSDNFFGKKLIELFQGLLEFLFIPADDPFSVIKDTLTAKFGFIDEIKETVAFMQSLFVAPTEAPVINVNIDSKYYSGDAKVIDLSFFTKFKPISDTLITVFVYLLFIWRLFKNLPSIISGFSSITGGGDGQ